MGNRGTKSVFFNVNKKNKNVYFTVKAQRVDGCCPVAAGLRCILKMRESLYRRGESYYGNFSFIILSKLTNKIFNFIPFKFLISKLLSFYTSMNKVLLPNSNIISPQNTKHNGDSNASSGSSFSLGFMMLLAATAYFINKWGFGEITKIILDLFVLILNLLFLLWESYFLP